MTALEEAKKQHVVVVTVSAASGSDSALPASLASAASSEELGRQESQDAPDGGALAWRQVLAGHLGNAVACGYPAIFGIFQLYYTSTLSLPASTISWIGSVQTFLNNLACVFAGRLADAGYAREAVMAGSAFVAVGVFMTSLATRYWEILLAQGVCTGIGLGLIYMPTIAVVNSYFRRRRSLALALTTSGTGTGSMVFPAIVQYLMPYIGFAWSIRCLGFLILVLMVFVNLLLRPRFAKPKAMGPAVELVAFKEPTFLLFAIGTFLVYWALNFGFFYINTFAMTLPLHAFTNTSTTTLLLITNGASTVSRILIGYLADNSLGPMNAYIVSVATLAASFFTWIAVTSGTGMYVWAAGFGVTSGAAQGAFVGALASLTVDPQRLGTRLGMVCGLLAFATLSGPPTAGAILGASEGWYGWAQIWAGVVEVLATVVLGAARWWLGVGLRTMV